MNTISDTHNQIRQKESSLVLLEGDIRNKVRNVLFWYWVCWLEMNVVVTSDVHGQLVFAKLVTLDIPGQLVFAKLVTSDVPGQLVFA